MDKEINALTELTVKVLKITLKQAGLSTDGLKKSLVHRLAEHNLNNQSAGPAEKADEASGSLKRNREEAEATNQSPQNTKSASGTSAGAIADESSVGDHEAKVAKIEHSSTTDLRLEKRNDREAGPPTVGNQESSDEKGEDLSGDGGLLKKVLVVGDAGCAPPPPGAEVAVHYVGTLLDGTKFDSSRDRGHQFKFKIGGGQVIKGWDQGVATMTRGEKAILTCRADYAYGEKGSPPNIPGGATLQFEVELFGWDAPVKQLWEMSAEELAAKATELKTAGTDAFKAKNWAAAATKYKEATKYGDKLLDVTDPDNADNVTLGNACQLNLAACALKLGNAGDSAAACDKVLGSSPDNVKALFRRGQARASLGDYKAARADLKAAARLAPKVKANRMELKAVKAAEKLYRTAEKKRFQVMFGGRGMYSEKKDVKMELASEEPATEEPATEEPAAKESTAEEC